MPKGQGVKVCDLSQDQNLLSENLFESFDTYAIKGIKSLSSFDEINLLVKSGKNIYIIAPEITKKDDSAVKYAEKIGFEIVDADKASLDELILKLDTAALDSDTKISGKLIKKLFELFLEDFEATKNAIFQLGAFKNGAEVEEKDFENLFFPEQESSFNDGIAFIKNPSFKTLKEFEIEMFYGMVGWFLYDAYKKKTLDRGILNKFFTSEMLIRLGLSPKQSLVYVASQKD